MRRILASSSLPVAARRAGLTLLVLLCTGTAQAQVDCAVQTDLPQAECEALVALYNSTGGADWLRNGDWLQTNSPARGRRSSAAAAPSSSCAWRPTT